MRRPWQFLPSKEAIAIGAALIVILVLVAAFYAKFPYPYEASSNWGLGAGWKCAQTQESEPVCIKDQSN